MAQARRRFIGQVGALAGTVLFGRGLAAAVAAPASGALPKAGAPPAAGLCEACVGDRFQVEGDGARAGMRLVAVERAASGGGHALRFAPLPGEPMPGEGLKSFASARMPEFVAFGTPVGLEGRHFQVVFSAP